MDYVTIFDLNGTIADTEFAYFKAYEEVLGQYDIAFTIDQFTDHWSKQGKKLGDYLRKIGREDLLEQEKDLLKMKDEIFQNTLEDRATLMPYVHEVLTRFTENNIKLALDSSTTRENIDTMLHAFNISQYFDEITSGDILFDENTYGPVKKKYARLKYLADKLGPPVAQCVMIGDAEKDVKGAKKAGMKAVAVPNQYTLKNDFSQADKIVNSLDEVDMELLSSLFV